MSVLTTLPEELYDSSAFKGFEAGSRFAIQNAKALAWMSQLAYETDNPEKVQRVLGSWGGHVAKDGIVVQSLKTHSLPMADSRCIFAIFPSTAVLSFGGTAPLSLANWITDFDTVFAPSNIAMGYQNAVDIIWPTLRQLLVTELHQQDSLLVVGHSLGAALAAIVAYQISIEGVGTVDAVYTFGMPRVGGELFRSAYNRILGLTTYRLVYGDDIVPTVAPSALGYSHIGRYLYAVHDQRFSAEKLSPYDFSDMPASLPEIATELLSKFQNRLPSIAPISTRMRIAGAVLAGLPVSSGRSDLTGILIEILPPQLRDHILDRYIAALI
jgi:triacylglycerol lipase